MSASECVSVSVCGSQNTRPSGDQFLPEFGISGSRSGIRSANCVSSIRSHTHSQRMAEFINTQDAGKKIRNQSNQQNRYNQLRCWLRKFVPHVRDGSQKSLPVQQKDPSVGTVFHVLLVPVP